MEEQQAAKEGLFEQIKEYLRLKTRLALLLAAEKAAEFYAGLVTNFILSVCLLMAFLFGSLALAFYLAELLGNTSLGFLCVTGIYLLLAILVQLIRKKYIEKPLMDSTVQKIFAERKDEYGA